jgi:NTE family protein
METKTNESGSRKKVGLALGGGGAKGLAHIGVIKILERAEVPIDFIAGTSMGALIGGWYAATGNIYIMEKLFLSLKDRKIIPEEKLVEKKDGNLFGDNSIVDLLEAAFSGKSLENCQIPFAAVATDVENGKEIVLKQGKLVDAVRASIALPVAFKPVKIEGKLLMDGGFANPVPADVVRAMGADIVIAVDVSSRWLNISSDDLMDVTKIKDIHSLIHELIGGVQYHITQRVLKEADVILKVPVNTLTWLEFNRAAEIIERGEAKTIEHMKEIEKKTGYKSAIKKTVLEKFTESLFNINKK